jgi:hypothetical protein
VYGRVQPPTARRSLKHAESSTSRLSCETAEKLGAKQGDSIRTKGVASSSCENNALIR